MPPGVSPCSRIATTAAFRHTFRDLSRTVAERLAIGGDALQAPIAKDAPVLDETLGE